MWPQSTAARCSRATARNARSGPLGRHPAARAAPTLGEGTHDVLQSLLGLSDEKLAALKTSGVV